MKTLKETIKEAEANQTAIGHFNIANLEGLWAIFRAAQTLNLPVIIGLSEGERDFVGARQARVLVSSLREEFAYPIWLSADHTYSLDRAQEAIDLGYDLIVFDRSELPLAENISETKRCVEYARSVNPEILVEGELGHIGKSSKLLDLVPEGVALTGAGLTTEAEAKQLVEATGVDLFSPAVGNFHGMLKSGGHPQIDVELIKKLRQAAGVPLVLHGGSGITNDGFSAAIKAGISIVHINTELRVVYRDALRQALADEPDEIAPYKILKNAVTAIREVTERRLKLFAGQVN